MEEEKKKKLQVALNRSAVKTKNINEYKKIKVSTVSFVSLQVISMFSQQKHFRIIKMR